MLCQEWWYLTVIPALSKWRQEDQEVEAYLGYIRRCPQKTKQERNALTSETISKGNKIIILKIYLHFHVHQKTNAFKSKLE